MAIDSEVKRASISSVGANFIGPSVVPDGTIDAADRAAAAGSYAGIQAAPLDLVPVVLTVLDFNTNQPVPVTIYVKAGSVLTLVDDEIYLDGACGMSSQQASKLDEVWTRLNLNTDVDMTHGVDGSISGTGISITTTKDPSGNCITHRG